MRDEWETDDTYVIRGDRQADPAKSVRYVREHHVRQVRAYRGHPRTRVYQVRGVLAAYEEVAPRDGRGESPVQAFAAGAARSESVFDESRLREMMLRVLDSGEMRFC